MSCLHKHHLRREKDVCADAVSQRTVLIVSPYFPPSGLAGVHRARHLAKHLPAAGWTPIVLCVDEKYHEQRLDPTLGALVPESVEIVKVGALPVFLTRLLGIGEISLRAWRPLKKTLIKLIETRRPSVVMITGSPFYPMLLAPLIKKRFDIPVLLDFQDPWVSSWGALQPSWSKAGVVHRIAVALEPKALRGADFITAVSDGQNAEMAERYPWFDQRHMAGIPIGGDSSDFTALGNVSADSNAAVLDPSYINLTYVGSFWPRVADSIRALLRAFARLRAIEPHRTSRIRLHFIGTNADPNDGATFHVRPIAMAEGVADAVNEVPQRVPYLQAVELMVQSNGLLLIGSDQPHYTASKIYPALMSGRPYLSLFHSASSAHAILTAAGGGQALAFENGARLLELEEPLLEGLRRLALSPEVFGKSNPAAYEAFNARNIAQRFGEIFNMITARTAR